MLFEDGLTISKIGIKSLNTGFSYDRNVVGGSGAGNITVSKNKKAMED